VIRLVLIDVDGTLVGVNGVHESTWPAVAEAREHGVEIALATGRIGVGRARELARRIGPAGLHVFHGGAVVSGIDVPPAHVVELPHEARAALVGESRRSGFPLELYTVDRYFLEWENDLTRLHARHLGLDPEVCDLLALDIPIVRALWPVPEADWPGLRSFTASLPDVELGPAAAPWAPGAVFGNVTRLGASKASALRWLAAHHGVTPAETAMIGDGENDLAALELAGLGIVVASAPEAVRAQADAVVGSPDEGGVAEALRVALAA
jgi:hypothetical protein